MTRKQTTRGESPRTPRQATPQKRVSGRPPYARGVLRRALTDPAILDAVLSEADAGSPESRALVVKARTLLLAAREPRPWTARAERRLAAYRRTRRDVRLHLPASDWLSMSVLLAWAAVPERSAR